MKKGRQGRGAAAVHRQKAPKDLRYLCGRGYLQKRFQKCIVRNAEKFVLLLVKSTNFRLIKLMLPKNLAKSPKI